MQNANLVLSRLIDSLEYWQSLLQWYKEQDMLIKNEWSLKMIMVIGIFLVGYSSYTYEKTHNWIDPWGPEANMHKKD